jgi:hypothetical protein
VLLAIPLVRPDMDKVFHAPEVLYLGFAIVGSALAAIALIGIAVLLLAHVFARPSTWCEFRPVARRDVRQVFELMQEFFGEETPSCSRILEWQRRNNAVLTAVYCKKLKHGRTKQELIGVFKVFPLTKQTVELLETEQVSGATLGASNIAAEGDEVAALYIGDVVASTRQGRAEVVRQLKYCIMRQLKPGISVYTRPLTSDGARLVRKYNFLPVMKDVPPGSVGRIHKLNTADSPDL